MAHMSYCQFELYQVTLNSGHKGFLLWFSIVASIAPNEEPMSINYLGNIDRSPYCRNPVQLLLQQKFCFV